MERLLGKKNAEMVMKVFNNDKDEQHFGFLKGKVSMEFLANLKALPTPNGLATRNDTFAFRAGVWVIEIITQEEDWIEVTIHCPYDHSGVFCTSNL